MRNIRILSALAAVALVSGLLVAPAVVAALEDEKPKLKETTLVVDGMT